MAREAHRDATMLTLMSFVSCYSGWQLTGADETEPAGTHGLHSCEEGCSEGCGRDELFSEHHTRGCQIAFLRAAAFPRTGLDRFGFVHLDGSFHPFKCSLYMHNLLLTRRQGANHPKIRAVDVWCPPLHRLARSQSQSCFLKFGSGQRANWVDHGMCPDLVAGKVPGLE